MTTTTTLVGFGFSDPTTVPDTTTFAANFTKVYDTLRQIENVLEDNLTESTHDIAKNTQNIDHQLEEIKYGMGSLSNNVEKVSKQLCELHDIKHSIDDLNATLHKFYKLLSACLGKIESDNIKNK